MLSKDGGQSYSEKFLAFLGTHMPYGMTSSVSHAMYNVVYSSKAISRKVINNRRKNSLCCGQL